VLHRSQIAVRLVVGRAGLDLAAGSLLASLLRRRASASEAIKDRPESPGGWRSFR